MWLQYRRVLRPLLNGYWSGLRLTLGEEIRKGDEKVVYSFKKFGEKKENGWCSWEIWRSKRIFKYHKDLRLFGDRRNIQEKRKET